MRLRRATRAAWTRIESVSFDPIAGPVRIARNPGSGLWLRRRLCRCAAALRGEGAAARLLVLRPDLSHLFHTCECRYHE